MSEWFVEFVAVVKNHSLTTRHLTLTPILMHYRQFNVKRGHIPAQ